ncbi:MAG: RluA family pseudouridine synthase [Burkholderiaceae bacterium]|nr:RluA family pseudouridine synthase [Burkholderiaceae bacterium]
MVLSGYGATGLAGVKAVLTPPLPVRDGVGPSFLWLPEGAWKDMQSFLAAWFADVAAATWQARMDKGEVVDQHGRRLQPDSPFKRGICMFYYREIEAETPIPFAEQVLYRDEHILVADKPHFLPVIPGGRFLHETLLVRLKKKLSLEHLVPLHRLDRETAGVVLFSHNPASRGAYNALFREHAMEKVYEALAPVDARLQFPMTYRSCIVKGTPFFRMQEVAGEPNSETRIDLLEQRGGIGRYQLRPVSGKQHQLRVHMAALGVPILNDGVYPDVLPSKGDDVSQPLKLLAQSIAFDDPISGQARSFTSAQTLKEE